MDAARAHDPLAGDGTPGRSSVATPDPDGPGNLAWQRTLQLLHQVEAEEDARRRRS